MPVTTPGDTGDALSRLVREALDRPGVTFRRLTEATVDPATGYRPGTTWLHKLVRNEVVRAPEPQVLRALAAGLGLPLLQVQRAAAAQYLDYVTTELTGLPADARAIVAHLAELDPADLPRVRAVIEALVAARTGSEGAGER
ncbi:MULTISPECIES: hypothetical protein [unclassified Kitasatospora]|uniref:hypothetical protein n=1 Tax=unclassified Kitasatospora TaxID=2633591 RepID=UPI00070E5958|nr:MULTISPECIES: hypothetical protein [unclassified Kitasatospora]KRB64061.1 hypothetical protein ASE03_05855 [Kitasatospora sp. Root187]